MKKVIGKKTERKYVKIVKISLDNNSEYEQLLFL